MLILPSFSKKAGFVGGVSTEVATTLSRSAHKLADVAFFRLQLHNPCLTGPASYSEKILPKRLPKRQSRKSHVYPIKKHTKKTFPSEPSPVFQCLIRNR